MLQLLDKKMTEQASLTLGAQIAQPGLDNKTRHILRAVQKSAPRFISSWAWLVAEHFDDLCEDDLEQLDKLCTATGFAFEPASLRQLSNIPALLDEILAQRERKAVLIASKERELIEGVQTGSRERLKQIDQNLQVREEQISKGDIGALQRTEQDMLKRMQGGRARLEGVFDEQAVKASQQFALLKTDIRDLARKYSRVEVIKETRTETYTVSTSKWYNPFSWGNEETRYRDVVTAYASAQDAIEQVQDFAVQTTRSLQKAIIDCVNLDRLRSDVGVAAMSLFDTSRTV